MRRLTFVMVAMLVTACGSAAPTSEMDQVRLQDRAAATLQSMLTKDPSLRPMLDSAAGYAVLPEIGKGGLVVGGAYGKGVLYERGGRFVGFVTLQQASLGAQIGAEAFAELIVFRDDRDVAHVKSSSYSMGAHASAIALTAGAGAEARFDNGVAVFFEPKEGAMAELSLNGQRLQYSHKGG